jgi:hypothetical protein
MTDNVNADVLYNLTMSYREWLMKSLKSIDQDLQLCVHFTTMSGGFLEFVNAYRCQDSRQKKRNTLCSSLMQRSHKCFLAVGPKAKSSWLVFASRARGHRGEIAELKPSHSPD